MNRYQSNLYLQLEYRAHDSSTADNMAMESRTISQSCLVVCFCAADLRASWKCDSAVDTWQRFAETDPNLIVTIMWKIVEGQIEIEALKCTKHTWVKSVRWYDTFSHDIFSQLSLLLQLSRLQPISPVRIRLHLKRLHDLRFELMTHMSRHWQHFCKRKLKESKKSGA